MKMDCPKFIPNIFNKTKCSQCFKIKEEHYIYRNGAPTTTTTTTAPTNTNTTVSNTTKKNNSFIVDTDTVDSGSGGGKGLSCVDDRGLLKCGHLFIAPLDFLPDDHHFKNKRWQRRWFILYDNGELSYSIDEHPDAIPQGTLNLNDVSEISSGEEGIGHQYSIILKCFNGTLHYLKGSTIDEYKKWIRLFMKYCSNTVGVIMSPIRRSSSSCASTASITTTATIDDHQSQDKVINSKVLSKVVNNEIKVHPVLRSYMSNSNCSYDKSSTHSHRQGLTTNEKEVFKESSGNTTSSCPVSSDKVTSSTSNTVKNKSTSHLLRGDPDGGEQIHMIDSSGIKSSNWLVNSELKTTNTVADEISVKLKNLKSQLSTKKIELEKVNKESIFKSDKLLIENLKLQLNSYFIEIDKLNYLITYKYSDLKSLIKCRENEVNELKKQLEDEVLITNNNDILLDENKLLVERINDLTEKYYNLDKSYKLIKTKLHRYRTNSLKDKELVENEIYSKIKQLETKINQYLPLDGTSPTIPTSDDKRGLINVILKLNELDKRLDASGPGTEWYKCSNCDYLQTEINHRDCKLNELESMVTNLESSVNYVNNMKMKYNQEITELRTLCSESFQTLESAYKRLIGELEEKQSIQLEELEMSKEKELEEETRATKNALELLKKNYEVELQNELGQLRTEFLIKYSKNNVSLEEMHLRHEDETNDLRNQLLDLTHKYTQKCLDYCQLEEKIRMKS